MAADRKVIVSAGELIEAKGHHLVAEALKGLLNEGYDAELVIVGSVGRGGLRFEETLRRRVLELGVTERVRFIGFVDRAGMAELLSAADVFCLASYTEGWPNVVNEALACGAPARSKRSARCVAGSAKTHLGPRLHFRLGSLAIVAAGRP